MKKRALTCAFVAIGLLPLSMNATAASADPGRPTFGCPNEGPSVLYTFTNVRKTTRPTDVYSAYITGPGTITYSESETANVEATASASVTAEAGVVFAKASTSIGVAVTAGRSWTAGFSYSLEVPAGQRRRMRLHQESRSFAVKKQVYSASKCKYVTSYSGQNANAPRKTRVDEWKLES